MSDGIYVWTDQKPDKPGWYWYKCDEAWCQYDPRIVEIIEHPGEPSKHWTVRGAGINWSLGNLPGQWSSTRIEEPKDEMHFEENVHLDLRGEPQ